AEAKIKLIRTYLKPLSGPFHLILWVQPVVGGSDARCSEKFDPSGSTPNCNAADGPPPSGP
ncbi:MAG: hypothetical protein ACLFWL_18720, partial [Candidatus Brocadiia bacterium]